MGNLQAILTLTFEFTGLAIIAMAALAGSVVALGFVASAVYRRLRRVR